MPSSRTTKHTNGNATMLLETIVPSLVEVHTNFDITPHKGLQVALEAVTGVERVYTNEKYKITCFFGKAFDSTDVAIRVKDAIWSFIAA